MCDRTNNSCMMASMYGQRDAGFFGYGHLTGGSGRSERVRSRPFGDSQLPQGPSGVSGECSWPPGCAFTNVLLR